MTSRRSAGALLASVLLLIACGGGGGTAASEEKAEPEDTRLEAAFNTCRGDDAGQTMTLGDGGATLLVDTKDEDGSIQGMACALVHIETPESIIAQVDRTSALMGVQDAEANGFTYSWTYHPDNGMNMVITDEEEGKG